jgi:hypothetical protein
MEEPNLQQAPAVAPPPHQPTSCLPRPGRQQSLAVPPAAAAAPSSRRRQEEERGSTSVTQHITSATPTTTASTAGEPKRRRQPRTAVAPPHAQPPECADPGPGVQEQPTWAAPQAPARAAGINDTAAHLTPPRHHIPSSLLPGEVPLRRPPRVRRHHRRRTPIRHQGAQIGTRGHQISTPGRRI